MSKRPRPIFLLPLIFLFGMFCARLLATVDYFQRLNSDFLAPIHEAAELVTGSYVTTPDEEKLQRSAIDGILAGLDDPYAQYIPPQDAPDFEKQLLGRFGGIGAEVQIENGLPTIVTPMDDSPAFRAGILAGDKITEVDGKPMSGLTIDKVVEHLVGEPGTTVDVKIRRGENVLDFKLQRQQIVVRAVKGVERAGPDGAWDFMLDQEKRIAYIRLSQFIPTAAVEVARALKSVGAEEGQLNGLILDLRNNPGGDLESCLDIADMFLKEGTIVSVRGRTGPGEHHVANSNGTLPDFPMVVMVNGFSASASEILAGALSDHKRATIVGARTFGKGTVQSVRSMHSKPGAQIKFTIQRYFLPSGRLIQRVDDSVTWGVDPTPGFYVPMADADELAYQLKRRSHDILGAHAVEGGTPRWSDAEWIDGELKDKQLAAAVRALGSRIAEGKWTPVSDAAQQFASMNMSELHRLEETHKRMLRAIAQVESRMTAMDSAIAGSTATRGQPDLWADELDLTNGNIKVYDKEGRMVAELRITGPDVEQWLTLADVEPAQAREDESQPQTEQSK